MHVNILILIVYTSNYQSNTILHENMRNDFAFFRIEDNEGLSRHHDFLFYDIYIAPTASLKDIPCGIISLSFKRCLRLLRLCDEIPKKIAWFLCFTPM